MNDNRSQGIVVGLNNQQQLRILTTQLQHNTTTKQQQHCGWVGRENDCANLILASIDHIYGL